MWLSLKNDGFEQCLIYMWLNLKNEGFEQCLTYMWLNLKNDGFENNSYFLVENNHHFFKKCFLKTHTFLNDALWIFL